MKKSLLLLAGIAATFASCAEDDNANPSDNEMTIHRIEKFTPSLADYNAGIYPAQKHVVYYQGSHIIADTLFNYQGAVEELITHTYSGNVHTQNIATPTIVTRVINETFDNEGRLTEYKTTFTNSFANNYTPVVVQMYTYNSNGTITRQQAVGDNISGMEPPAGTVTYTTNADGYIYGGLVNGAVETGITYNGDKPVQSGIYNFTYYNTPMPENMKPAAAQTNNAVLNRYMNQAAENCSYYLQSYNGYVTYESQFNALNYITHSKITGQLPNEDVYDSELFFYYNQ